MADIFISYKREDIELAKALAERFEDMALDGVVGS